MSPLLYDLSFCQFRRSKVNGAGTFLSPADCTTLKSFPAEKITPAVIASKTCINSRQSALSSCHSGLTHNLMVLLEQQTGVTDTKEVQRATKPKRFE
jgi:hypothetical protein